MDDALDVLGGLVVVVVVVFFIVRQRRSDRFRERWFLFELVLGIYGMVLLTNASGTTRSRLHRPSFSS